LHQPSQSIILIKFRVFYVLLFCHFSLFSQVTPDTAFAEINFDKALEFLKTGKYDSAHVYYLVAKEIYEKTDFEDRKGVLFYHLGLSRHFNRMDMDALEYYKASLGILQKIKPDVDPFITDLYNNIGSIYLDQGYRFKARPYLRKALVLNEALYGNDNALTGICYYNNGLMAMYFGEYKTSLDYFMKARPIYIKSYGESSSKVAQLYTNVGILHRNIGDLGLAREYFERGVAIHLENHGPEYWNLAFPYSNLAEINQVEGNTELSMDYRLKSLELCRNNPDRLRRLEASVLAAIAVDLRKQGDFAGSTSKINEAIEILKTKFHDNFPRIGDFYNILGDISVDQKDYVNADYWYQKSIEIIIYNYGSIHPKLAGSYHKQSQIYSEKKLYDRSLKLIQKGFQSLTASFTSGDYSDYPSIDSVLDQRQYLRLTIDRGNVLKQRGEETQSKEDLLDAISHYEMAASVIDRIRRGYLSENSKLFMQEKSVSIYEKAIASCSMLFKMEANEDYLDKAFFFMEKSKSSVLSEALQASTITNIRGISQEVLAREEELTAYVQSLELKYSDAQIDESDSSQQALKKELFHAKSSVDSLAGVIKHQYPNYHNLKYNTDVLHASEVKDLIKKNTIILSFFEGDSTWYVMGMGHDGLYLSDVPKNKLKPEEIEDFRVTIADPSSSVEEFSTNAYKIYQNLISDVISQYPSVEKLWIVPDGNLGYIPFDALLKEPYSSGLSPNYLIKSYTISYANSVTLIKQNAERERGYEQDYIGFAPDYPETFIAKNVEVASPIYRDELTKLLGTKEEVNFASEIFAGSTFIDKEASEENFKNLIKSPAILHLAMHALLNDKDPMRSQLIFTHGADSLEDGRLNAYEIYNLHINSELAVLSACNTGIGKINKGEGVLSLSRAFMYAGCPNIVMSLWRAKDQPSAQIMSVFFENLKQNMGKDEALRNAKLSYLEDADPLKAHPANWATFVLLGDSAPISGNSTKIYIWAAVGILFLFLLIFARAKNKRIKTNA